MKNGISHVKNATAAPRENGQVERQNQTLLTALTTMYNKVDGKDWDQHVRNIQFALNDMEHKTTKRTPHQFLFGFHPRDTLTNDLAMVLQDLQPQENSEEIRQEVLQKIQRQQQKDKVVFDRKRKTPTKYSEGNLVMTRRELTATGTSRKLLPLFKGPYMVGRVLGNDRYELRDIPGAERTHRSF